MLVAEIVDILLDVAVYIETYSLKGVTVLGSFAEQIIVFLHLGFVSRLEPWSLLLWRSL